MQENEALQFQKIGEVLHVLIPGHKFGDRSQTMGTASGQSVCNGESDISDQELTSAFVEDEFKIAKLNSQGIKGASDLIWLLDDLRSYATKTDLTEEKKLAARALLDEQVHYIKAFSDDPKQENIVKTKDALTKSAQHPLYQCLTKSGDEGHKAENWALFFPVFVWAVALYNRAKTGSWAFRSHGGKQRKAIEKSYFINMYVLYDSLPRTSNYWCRSRYRSRCVASGLDSP